MDVLGFAFAVLLIELTPGPNMGWLAALAAVEGRKAGLSAVAGVAVGLLLNGILAALGLASLLEAVPQVLTALRIAGAAMMIWLAVQAWRDADRIGPVYPSDRNAGRPFVAGALINLFNPKAYLFFVVVVPQFLGGAVLSLGNAIALALISTTIATAIHLAIVLAGSGAHDWLSDPIRTRTVRRIFALLMIAVAASFLLVDLD